MKLDFELLEATLTKYEKLPEQLLTERIPIKRFQ